MTLIAKILIVASTVDADGKTKKDRQEFQPGEVVTGLSEHDVRELLKMKALIDTDREEARDQYDAMRTQHAQRDFERERQAVQQQRESTKAQAAPAAGTDGQGSREGSSAGESAAPAPDASTADATAAPPASAADAPAPAAPAAPKPARGQKSN